MPSPFYVVIKNMSVINVNLSSSYLTADLSQNAYLGFAHHLARFIDEKLPHKKVLGKIKKIQLGHEATFSILKHVEFYKGYTGLTGHLRDKNHQALNIPMNPPEIKGALKQTLVIRLFARSTHKETLQALVKTFLLFNRFAGGDIQNPQHLTVEILTNHDDLTENLQWEKGWVVNDATAQLVTVAKEKGYPYAFCDFLATFKTISKKTTQQDKNKATYQRHYKGWYYASLAGYQLLEPPKQRDGARYNAPHAFAEPIIGLHKLDYFKNTALQHLFWHSTFNDNDNTYLFVQS